MKALLFDLFETLITHFDPEWTPPEQSIAQRLEIDESTYARLWSDYDIAWQAGEIGCYTDALARLCEAAGQEPDHRVLNKLADEYRRMTARVFEHVEPEILEMIITLKELGWKLGIITNAGDLDTAPWYDCRLADYFDDFLTSHEVGLLKRDALIFKMACLRIGVHPGETLFVGDGGGNELQGATQAGLRVYWCTWFLDRWPEGIRPNHFPGDNWRQFSSVGEPPFERLERPADLLERVGNPKPA